MFKPIRSYENYTINDKGVVKNSHGRILKTFLSNGYERGLPSVRMVIAPKQGTTQIDHIDRRRNNNNIKNLRRVTAKQNYNSRGQLM